MWTWLVDLVGLIGFDWLIFWFSIFFVFSGKIVSVWIYCQSHNRRLNCIQKVTLSRNLRKTFTTLQVVLASRATFLLDTRFFLGTPKHGSTLIPNPNTSPTILFLLLIRGLLLSLGNLSFAEVGEEALISGWGTFFPAFPPDEHGCLVLGWGSGAESLNSDWSCPRSSSCLECDRSPGWGGRWLAFPIVLMLFSAMCLGRGAPWIGCPLFFKAEKFSTPSTEFYWNLSDYYLSFFFEICLLWVFSPYFYKLT